MPNKAVHVCVSSSPHPQCIAGIPLTNESAAADLYLCPASDLSKNNFLFFVGIQIHHKLFAVQQDDAVLKYNGDNIVETITRPTKILGMEEF